MRKEMMMGKRVMMEVMVEVERMVADWVVGGGDFERGGVVEEMVVKEEEVEDVVGGDMARTWWGRLQRGGGRQHWLLGWRR